MTTRMKLFCMMAATGLLACSQDVQQVEEESAPSKVPTWSSIATGVHATCSIDREGRTACWGRWPSGINYGVTKDMLRSPEYLEELDDATQVVFDQQNHFNACALLASGETWCWGSRSTLGNFGDPGAYEPRRVEGMSGLEAVALGSSMVCGLQGDGLVLCKNFDDEAPRAQEFERVGRVTSIAAHAQTLCAILEDGGVECQGTQVFGSFEPDDGSLDDITDAMMISMHDDHVCIARSGGTITCLYRLSLASPTYLTSIEASGIKSLSSMRGQVCAHLESSEVTCWDVTSGAQTSNEPLDASLTWSASDTHTCALDASGVATCQGNNLFGQLGRGDADLQVFARALELPGHTLLEAGERHTCMLDAQGVLTCMGELPGGLAALQGKDVYALHTTEDDWVAAVEGDLVAQGEVIAPGGDDPFTSVSFGSGVCGLRRSGKLECTALSNTSENYNGLFGRYARLDTGVLKRLSPGHGRLVELSLEQSSMLLAMEVSVRNMCAWFASGEIWCEGENTHGELGRLTATDEIRHPFARVELPAKVVHASFESRNATYLMHGCAVVEGGDVYCWGKNHFGQLGDGTTVDRTQPVKVEGIEGARRVLTGMRHTCAEHGEGVISCWGDSLSGQTGERFRSMSQPPAVVSFKDGWAFE